MEGAGLAGRSWAVRSSLGWGSYVTFLQGYKAELGTNSITSKPAPTFG